MTEKVRVNPREFNRTSNDGDFKSTEFDIAGFDSRTIYNMCVFTLMDFAAILEGKLENSSLLFPSCNLFPSWPSGAKDIYLQFQYIM